jgi:hypothetical protein
MQNFASEESKRLGTPVSIAAITMADSLNQHPQLRKKFEKLKKEKQRNGTNNRTTGRQSN